VVADNRPVFGEEATHISGRRFLAHVLAHVAFIGMMSSGYRRRFGDRWGDTYVVNAETDLLTRG